VVDVADLPVALGDRDDPLHGLDVMPALVDPRHVCSVPRREA
jgi:hypothetical protein